MVYGWVESSELSRTKDENEASLFMFMSLWTISKVFIAFGYSITGTLAPWPGIKARSPAMEGQILTTEWPGKSPQTSSYL